MEVRPTPHSLDGSTPLGGWMGTARPTGALQAVETVIQPLEPSSGACSGPTDLRPKAYALVCAADPLRCPWRNQYQRPRFLLKSAARRPMKGRHLSLTQIFYVSRETAPSSRRRRPLSTAATPGDPEQFDESISKSFAKQFAASVHPRGLRIHIGSCRRSLWAEEENPDVSPGIAETSRTYSSGKGDRSQSSWAVGDRLPAHQYGTSDGCFP